MFKRCPAKYAVFAVLLAAILIVLMPSVYAEEQAGWDGEPKFELIDAFETHNLHGLPWGDQNEFMYSDKWCTQGSYALDFRAFYGGNGWTALSTGCFDAETPDSIKLDAKCHEGTGARIKLEILDSGGQTRTLGTSAFIANGQELNDITFNNQYGYSVRMLRFIIEGYSSEVNVGIDNIRFVKNGSTVLWDSCEDHFYWDGTADADNADGEASRSDDISREVFSPNFSSTSSQILEWNAYKSSAITAEIQIKKSLQPVDKWLDIEDCWYFRFDAYRPSSTPNVDMKVYLYDGTKGVSTAAFKIDTPDQWTTITLPLHEPNHLSNVSEIKIVVLNTNTYTEGRLYFDNLQAGGFMPETGPADLGTLGYPHLLQDFTEGFEENSFYGGTLTGSGSGGAIDCQLSTTEYYTSPALKIDYNVSAGDSYIYYNNTLHVNSEKKLLSLYLKGGAGNPGRIKLELRDESWSTSGGTSGRAYCCLSGISADEWKQWIVNVNSEDLSVTGSFDPANIVEVVLALDNRSANLGAKSGTFYVDDITFVDSTDILTPYPGYEINLAPVLDPIGDKTVNEGELLQFTVTAVDANNDTLAYSAGSLPDGAIFDAGTGVFTWNLPAAGTYTGVHFEASDGELSDSEDITITVNEAGMPELFFDDFDDGNDDGWIDEYGDWSVINGEYTCASYLRDRNSYVNSGLGLNYNIDCDINITEGGPYCIMGVIYSNADKGCNNTVEVLATGKAYVNTEISQEDADIPAWEYNTWHHIRVEVSQQPDSMSSIKVFVDDEFVIEKLIRLTQDIQEYIWIALVRILTLFV